MSLLNGSAVKAREVIDFCMANESPELKAKVFEIISRSELEPNDPMFMTLLLTGQMRVFLEAAPLELGRLLSEWKQQNASSLSEITTAIERVNKMQQEQAEMIQSNMETVSSVCVADIKEAGMATVGAIAQANSETFERAAKIEKQNEELKKEIIALHAQVKAERQQNTEIMTASSERFSKTAKSFDLANRQFNNSTTAIRKLQQNTFWLKWADWFSPLSALAIVGGVCFALGGWLTYREYNTFTDRLGRDLTEWNLSRLVHCKKTENPKCTIWIVPPDSPQRQE